MGIESLNASQGNFSILGSSLGILEQNVSSESERSSLIASKNKFLNQESKVFEYFSKPEFKADLVEVHCLDDVIKDFKR